MAPIHDACIRGDLVGINRILSPFEKPYDKTVFLLTKDASGTNCYVLLYIHKHYDALRDVCKDMPRIIMYVMNVFENVQNYFDLDPTLHDIIWHEYDNRDLLAKVENLLETKPYLVSTRNKDGETPLHVACHSRLFKVAKLLLEKGSDVNAVNLYLEQPIHYLCDVENYDNDDDDEEDVGDDKSDSFSKTLELLLQYGADLNAKNIHNKTPLNYMYPSDSSSKQIAIFQSAFTKSLMNHMTDMKTKNEKLTKESVVPQLKDLFIHVSLAMKQLNETNDVK